MTCASSWNYILEYYYDARTHEHQTNNIIINCSLIIVISISPHQSTSVHISTLLHVLHQYFPYYKQTKRSDRNIPDGLSARLSIVGASEVRLIYTGTS